MSNGRANKITGVVKFYNDAKGYGFITSDVGGNDIFVHINCCDERIDELTKGQRVPIRGTDQHAIGLAYRPTRFQQRGESDM